MTYQSGKHRPGNPQQTYRSTGRNRQRGREKAASGSLHGFARRRCRLARRHRATMLAPAPAAGRKPGVRIRGEHQRAHRRQAEKSHQQHRQTSEHWDYYTPHPAKPYLRGRKLRLRGPCHHPITSSRGRPAACSSRYAAFRRLRAVPSAARKSRNSLQMKDETKIAAVAFNTTKWTTREGLTNGA
jgi:hypothetical protein